MKDIMKIYKYIKESGLLNRGVSKTTKNETKNKKVFGILLGTLGPSVSENMSTDKGVIRAGEGTIKGGQDF